MIKIKLDGIDSLSAARFAAAAGAEFMGFELGAQMPHYLPPFKALEMIQWTHGTASVAAFENEAAEKINELLEFLDAAYLQLPAARWNGDAGFVRPVILLLDCTNLSDAEFSAAMAAPGANVFAWQLKNIRPEHFTCIAERSQLQQIIMEVSSAEALIKMRDLLKPFAFSFTVPQEDKTGISDFDALQEMIDLLRS